MLFSLKEARLKNSNIKKMLKHHEQSKISKYQFQIRHVTVFLMILIVFQIILALVQKSSMNDFLVETQSWYQKYSADRLAIVTATSMELLFENLFMDKPQSEYDERRITYTFNVIFKQQLIQKSVKDISLILIRNHRLYVIDSGQKLYSYLIHELPPSDSEKDVNHEGVKLFLSVRNKMKASEIIYSKRSASWCHLFPMANILALCI